MIRFMNDNFPTLNYFLLSRILRVANPFSTEVLLLSPTSIQSRPKICGLCVFNKDLRGMHCAAPFLEDPKNNC